MFKLEPRVAVKKSFFKDFVLLVLINSINIELETTYQVADLLKMNPVSLYWAVEINMQYIMVCIIHKCLLYLEIIIKNINKELLNIVARERILMIRETDQLILNLKLKMIEAFEISSKYNKLLGGIILSLFLNSLFFISQEFYILTLAYYSNNLNVILVPFTCTTVVALLFR